MQIKESPQGILLCCNFFMLQTILLPVSFKPVTRTIFPGFLSGMVSAYHSEHVLPKNRHCRLPALICPRIPALTGRSIMHYHVEHIKRGLQKKAPSVFQLYAATVLLSAAAILLVQRFGLADGDSDVVALEHFVHLRRILLLGEHADHRHDDKRSHHSDNAGAD